MIVFYLMPTEVSADGFHRGPLYLPWRFKPTAALVQANSEKRDYGDEGSVLVAAEVDAAQDALLSAQLDVTRFADNLDQQLGADLSAMQAALEATNLPAQMLTVNTTHRLIIRGIMAIFAVVQCMQGKGFKVFGGAVNLSTTMGNLGAPARQALTDCVDSLHYDRSGITLASTVRQLLTILVQQDAPSTMMGVTV